MIRHHIFTIFAQCSEYDLGKCSLSSDLTYLDFLFQLAIIKIIIIRSCISTVTWSLQSHFTKTSFWYAPKPYIHQCCILRWRLKCKERCDFPKGTRRKWWSDNLVQVSFFSSKCLALATTAHDYPARDYLETWSIKNVPLCISLLLGFLPLYLPNLNQNIMEFRESTSWNLPFVTDITVEVSDLK